MGCDHVIATGGVSVLNRAVCGRPWCSTNVRPSRLGCLSSLMWFACSHSASSLALPLYVLSCAEPKVVYRHCDRISTKTCSQFYCL